MNSTPAAAASSPLPTPRLPRVVLEFLRTETSGGLVLLLAAGVAMVWANSPWRAGYEALWSTEVTLRAGRFVLANDLRHWVNDGLMAVFFFVVGLEIKRELVTGELRHWRTAALPAVAALGGMVVPALVYASVNLGREGAGGWGIPMATDIAFALGVVALLGSRVPGPLKLFLLTLAIVDDIGAIVVIAAVYSEGVAWTALAAAGALLVVLAGLRRARVRSLAPFVVVGIGVWVAVFESGVHATIAGVVLGLLAPARPLTAEGVVREWALDLSDEPSREDLRVMTEVAKGSRSVAERLEHQLHPWASFFIVPVFALANAGVRLDADAVAGAGAARVAVGTALGLALGKLVGISGSAWLAVRLGLGQLPRGVGWTQLVGVAAVAGIGFTVSLFVAGLAFEAPVLQEAAKLGVLAGSLVASALGASLLWAAGGRGSSGE